MMRTTHFIYGRCLCKKKPRRGGRPQAGVKPLTNMRKKEKPRRGDGKAARPSSFRHSSGVLMVEIPLYRGYAIAPPPACILSRLQRSILPAVYPRRCLGLTCYALCFASSPCQRTSFQGLPLFCCEHQTGAALSARPRLVSIAPMELRFLASALCVTSLS